MKKNKMMRIAAILLIVTLISTCAISGTFAKYITKGEGDGNARVAAWGIEISMEDNLFAAQYETDDAAYEGDYSVVSADLTDVVAPGTKKDDAITATIKGTPEVATRLYLDLGVESDVMLEEGTYLDYTTGLVDDDEFDLDADYYPVKFDIAFQGTIANHRNMSFKLSDIAGFAGLDIDDGVSLTELTEWLDENEGYYPVIGNTNAFGLGIDEDGRIYVDVPAGKTIDGTFTLSWNWAFEQEPMDDPMDNSSMYDKADTYLGDAAAAATYNVVDGKIQNYTQSADYPGATTALDFTFAAAAVQID